MLLALVIFASEAAAGDEPSATAFYIGGLLFAVFAVIVGVLGITRPDGFAATAGARTGIVAVAAVLMAAACATAVLSS